MNIERQSATATWRLQGTQALSALALAVFVAAPLSSGCFSFLNRCEQSANCPAPEQCLSGFCYDPVSLGLPTCTTDAECAGSTCYEGFCQTTGGGPGFTPDGCLSDHSNCPDSYCGFDDSCVPADEAGNVFVADNFDEEFVVLNTGHIDDLRGVDTLVGNLHIGHDYWDENVASIDVGEMVFDDLRVVTGNIVIKRQKDATAIRFPRLIHVGGDIDVGGSGEDINDIRTLDFPALVKVEGDQSLPLSTSIDLDGNRLLHEINFPVLTIVGSFDIEGPDPEGNGDVMPQPLIINAPVLEKANWYWVDSNGVSVQTLNIQIPNRLFSLWLDSLDVDVGPYISGITEVEDNLTLANLPATPNIVIDSLTSVGGEVRITRNDITSSISMASVTTVESIDISDNDVLTSLNLSSLTTMTGSSLDISGNPMLDVCQAVAVKDALGVASADATLTGNSGDPDTCN